MSMSESTKHAIDAVSFGAVVATLAAWLPPMAAAASLGWSLIRIYETKTVQGWMRKLSAESKEKPTGVVPLAVLAGVMTGAEALVAAGVDLPGSDAIPVWARAAVIFGIAGGAFVLRTMAQRAAR